MKRALFLAMFSGSLLIAFNAISEDLTIHGPITFSWTVYQQSIYSSNEYSGSGKVVISGTGNDKTTNVLQIAKSTSTGFTFKNADFLHLVANSLNDPSLATNELATDGSKVYVVDKTGTNIIKDLSTLVTLDFGHNAFAGLTTTTTTSKKSGTSSTQVAGYASEQFIDVIYDDSSVTNANGTSATADGTLTQFNYYGFGSMPNSSSQTTSNGVVTGTQSTSFSYQGVGNGRIRAQYSLFKGSLVGSAAGHYSY